MTSPLHAPRLATQRSFGHAWVALGAALAVHVADEAAHDFLALYNPNARAIQERLGGFPFPPTFSFTAWLTGLIVAVIAWLALAPLAYRGHRWLLPLAAIGSMVHVANGVGHVITSFWLGRAAPGVWSAPLLLASAVWMLTILRHLRRARAPTWEHEPNATAYDLKQLAFAVFLFELVVAGLAFATRAFFGIRTALWVGLGIGALVLAAFIAISLFGVLTHTLATWLARRETRGRRDRSGVA